MCLEVCFLMVASALPSPFGIGPTRLFSVLLRRRLFAKSPTDCCIILVLSPYAAWVLSVMVFSTNKFMHDGSCTLRLDQGTSSPFLREVQAHSDSTNVHQRIMLQVNLQVDPSRCAVLWMERSVQLAWPSPPWPVLALVYQPLD